MPAVKERLYRKILIVVMLDTLARAWDPSGGNKERFIRLVNEHADWPDSQRVSLPQLLLVLQAIPTRPDSELVREVQRRLSGWQYGRIYRLDMDALASALEPLAGSDDERRLITNSRHADLLYTYRNHLVHEFREPGYAMEISDNDSTPYYHGMTTEQGHDSWELVYPIGFFLRIGSCCLANLKRHLEENDLDPYSSYEFGSIWRPR